MKTSLFFALTENLTSVIRIHLLMVFGRPPQKEESDGKEKDHQKTALERTG